MELSLKDYYYATTKFRSNSCLNGWKSQNTLSPNYVKTLRKLGANNYEIAFTSFLHSNKNWIIEKVDRKNLTIKYLNGDISTYEDWEKNKFFNKIDILNKDFSKKKKSYFKRYFKIMKRLKKRRELNLTKRIEALRSKFNY